MPRDYAQRTTSKSKPRRRRSAARVSPKPRVLFHGPSFSSGAIVGALVVIVAAYAPELLDLRVRPQADPVPAADTQPKVTYEFPKLLKEQEVKADPEPYAVPEALSAQAPQQYLIQAASFRSSNDADTLRAQLLLADLPAYVDYSQVGERAWFRVTVGPFERKVEADRAMTHLRSRGLSAMWVNARG